MRSDSRTSPSLMAVYGAAVKSLAKITVRRACARRRCSTGVKSASPDRMMNSSK